MRTWMWAGTLALLAACSAPDERSVTREDGPTGATGDIGQLVLREPYRDFRDAKETRNLSAPRFVVFNEGGQAVYTARTWYGEEDTRITLPAGRYRVAAPENLAGNDQDEVWITIAPNGRTVVDLDAMEEVQDVE